MAQHEFVGHECAPGNIQLDEDGEPVAGLPSFTFIAIDPARNPQEDTRGYCWCYPRPGILGSPEGHRAGPPVVSVKAKAVPPLVPVGYPPEIPEEIIAEALGAGLTIVIETHVVLYKWAKYLIGQVERRPMQVPAEVLLDGTWTFPHAECRGNEGLWECAQRALYEQTLVRVEPDPERPNPTPVAITVVHTTLSTVRKIIVIYVIHAFDCHVVDAVPSPRVLNHLSFAGRGAMWPFTERYSTVVREFFDRDLDLLPPPGHAATPPWILSAFPGSVAQAENFHPKPQPPVMPKILHTVAMKAKPPAPQLVQPGTLTDFDAPEVTPQDLIPKLGGPPAKGYKPPPPPVGSVKTIAVGYKSMAPHLDVYAKMGFYIPEAFFHPPPLDPADLGLTKAAFAKALANVPVKRPPGTTNLPYPTKAMWPIKAPGIVIKAAPESPPPVPTKHPPPTPAGPSRAGRAARAGRSAPKMHRFWLLKMNIFPDDS